VHVERHRLSIAGNLLAVPGAPAVPPSENTSVVQLEVCPRADAIQTLTEEATVV